MDTVKVLIEPGDLPVLYSTHYYTRQPHLLAVVYPVPLQHVLLNKSPREGIETTVIVLDVSDSLNHTRKGFGGMFAGNHKFVGVMPDLGIRCKGILHLVNATCFDCVEEPSGY